MRYITLSAMAALFIFASCGNSGDGAMTESQFNARVDSLVGEKIDDLNRHYAEDLEQRIAIEVKVKADSIVEARQQGR